MFGFGKKKIKAAELVPVYVTSILEVAQSGFPEIAGYINDEPEFIRSPNISDAENEWFLYIVLAGNIIQLDQHFSKNQAEEFARLIAADFVQKFGKDPEITDQILYEYETFLRKLFAQTKNLVKAMSLAIFHKYDLNKYQTEHFQKLNAPNPIVMKELNEMTDYFLWNWEGYLQKFKVTS